jgi:hypothetical protein
MKLCNNVTCIAIAGVAALQMIQRAICTAAAKVRTTLTIDKVMIFSIKKQNYININSIKAMLHHTSIVQSLLHNRTICRRSAADCADENFEKHCETFQ